MKRTRHIDKAIVAAAAIALGLLGATPALAQTTMVVGGIDRALWGLGSGAPSTGGTTMIVGGNDDPALWGLGSGAPSTGGTTMVVGGIDPALWGLGSGAPSTGGTTLVIGGDGADIPPTPNMYDLIGAMGSNPDPAIQAAISQYIDSVSHSNWLWTLPEGWGLYPY